MITGETEALVQAHLLDDYDDFFGNKKKRQARRAKRKARRLARRLERNSAKKAAQGSEKRGGFFNDVGQIYKDIGGGAAIGGVIDSIIMPKDTPSDTLLPQADPVGSDYELSIAADEKNEEPENEKKGIPTAIYIVGGIVIVGIVGLLILNQKNKQTQPYPQ